MKPILAVDVDSTVWDTGAWVREAVLETTGETLDEDTTSTWTHLLDRYGEEATTRIFDRVNAPERITEREPYPHAPEVLKAIQEEWGMAVHFVTRAWDAAAVTSHLTPWLRKHFGDGVGLSVVDGDKLSVLRELRAFGVIDDRPDTIESAADLGLWVAAKLQPWNRRFVSSRGDVHGFEDWREVPGLLPVLSK